MPVTLIQSRWASGSLIFHESGNYGNAANVLTLAQSAVTVGNGSNDVDLVVNLTGSGSVTVDYGAGSLKLVACDIDLSTSGTGVYDVILKDSVADALSIRRATTDMMVFDSSTPKIAITPAVTFGGAITPAASDGAALGSATVMWADLFLASGGVINWNNGDVTLTHGANLLTLAGGAWNTGADGAGVDSKLFGGTASCYLEYDASEDRLNAIQTNNATTGVETTVSVQQTHTGVGASAEALESIITSNVALGTYANAIFGKIDLSNSGEVTGLIGVICAEITMPDTDAPSGGEYAAFEAEFNMAGASVNGRPMNVLDINVWGGNETQFDATAYLFDITGVTSGASSFWYDNQKAAPAVEEFIRVRTPSGVRYLALYDANA